MDLWTEVVPILKGLLAERIPGKTTIFPPNFTGTVKPFLPLSEAQAYAVTITSSSSAQCRTLFRDSSCTALALEHKIKHDFWVLEPMVMAGPV